MLFWHHWPTCPCKHRVEPHLRITTDPGLSAPLFAPSPLFLLWIHYPHPCPAVPCTCRWCGRLRWPFGAHCESSPLRLTSGRSTFPAVFGARPPRRGAAPLTSASRGPRPAAPGPRTPPSRQRRADRRRQGFEAGPAALRVAGTVRGGDGRGRTASREGGAAFPRRRAASASGGRRMPEGPGGRAGPGRAEPRGDGRYRRRRGRAPRLGTERRAPRPGVSGPVLCEEAAGPGRAGLGWAAGEGEVPEGRAGSGPAWAPGPGSLRGRVSGENRPGALRVEAGNVRGVLLSH